MKYSVIIVIGIALISACSPRSHKPADVLSEEKFIELMTDIRLLEGAYSSRYQRVDSSTVKIDAYYLGLFEKHLTSKEEFLRTYHYYSSNIEDMERIEDVIMEKLSELQARQESFREVKEEPLDLPISGHPENRN